MEINLKTFIKKILPSRVIEVFSRNKINISKIPSKDDLVVSDLFLLRVEKNWETNFEILNINLLTSPKSKVENYRIRIFFFNQSGNEICLVEKNIENKIKFTLSISKLALKNNITTDSLFLIQHIFQNKIYNQYKSFPAERGYIGYYNSNFGSIKSYVHGNLDAISISPKKEIKNLGEYSFFDKQFRLQHVFKSEHKYEIYIINTTSKSQNFKILEKSNLDSKYKILKIKPRGFAKYVKEKNNSHNIKIIIESKLYMARPIIFKYMKNSFDIYHG